MNSKRRTFFAALVTGLLVLSLFRIPIAAQTSEPIYDLVIRNGRVLDGAGNPWILADVAIKDGRFVRIGKIDGKGKREIDATGRYVSPGWIDMLDQSGGVLTRNGLAESKLQMGVTTGIAGEAGTPVPAEKLAEYFANLQKSGISMNFGTAYSETQARVAVLGQSAREPTPEELVRMGSIVRDCDESGSIRNNYSLDISARGVFKNQRAYRNGQGCGTLRWLLFQPRHAAKGKNCSILSTKLSQSAKRAAYRLKSFTLRPHISPAGEL